jgi:hypothetical protein
VLEEYLDLKERILIVSMEEKRNSFKTLVGRPDGNRPQRDPGEDVG